MSEITKSTYQSFLPASQIPIPDVMLLAKFDTPKKPELIEAIDNLTFAISAAAAATSATDDLSPLYFLQQVINDLTTLQKFAKQTLKTALDLRVATNAWTDGEFEIKETYSNRKVNVELFREKFPDQYNTLFLTEVEKFQAEFRPGVTNTKTVLNSRQQNEVFYQEVNGHEIIKVGGVNNLSR